MKLKFLIIAIIIGIFSATDARGAIAPLISYQAKLTDISNQPVPDGNYNFRFRIYNVPSGGTPLWTEEYTGVNKVLVSSGLFNVLLGSIIPLTSIDFNQNPLYLSIEVGKTSDPPEWDGEMSPRKRISSAPYAFNADKLDGIDSSALVQTSRQIISGTGLVGGGDLSADRTISLANTAVTAGSYGSASQVAVFTVDAQGRLTAASNTDIAIAASAITSGTLSLTRGGTGADLSTTGGPNQFVKQTTLGGPLTVGPILDADVPDDITLTNITQITNRAITDTTGILPISRGGTGLTSIGIADQILGTNATATGLEYKNLASLLTAGTNVSISGTTNVTIATVANPTFSTSVTTPILQTSSGALTLQTGASVEADDIVFSPAGAEKMRILENGDLFFEKGVNDVTLIVTAPTASRTYTIPDFGANVSLVGSNRAINTTLPLSGGGDLSADRTLSIGGLSSLGTANYVVGVNSTASAWEYKNIVGTASEIDITHTAGQIQIGLVDPLAVSKGGTGVTALSDILGTANQITVTNGTGRVIGGNVTLSLPQDIHTGASPTFSGLNLSGLTSGSILFAGSGGAISQDNTNLFWDNTNKRLGIGTTGPAAKLDVVNAGGQTTLRVAGDTVSTSWQARLLLQGDDYRGLGMWLASNIGGTYTPWFIGRPYASTGFTIGFHSTQPEYLANSKLFIDNTGNVGIGTTGPATKLHVIGDATFSGYLAAGTNPATTGIIRLPNNQFIYARNTGNTADRQLLGLDSSNRLVLGDSNINNFQLPGVSSLTIDLNYSGNDNTLYFTNSNSSYGLSVNIEENLIVNGNVGIGTTTPGAKLEVAGTTLTNREYVAYYRNVIHASNNSPTLTGTLKITLPKTWSNTMMKLRIEGFNYSGGARGTSWSVVVGGYNYVPTPSWINYFAEIHGAAPFNQVRLGHDGTYNVILLGTTSTSWSYPKVAVTEFMAGYSNITGWDTGWSISWISDETGITNIVTPTIDVFRNTSGNVGIGTTAPGYLLHVSRSTDGDVAGFTDANGTCTINPTNTALICSSDIRAKEVIGSLSGSLEKMMALNPIIYRWKNQTDNALRFGFGAQEVEEIIPELVLTAPDGSKSLNYIGFTPFLVNAIQELSKQIESLKLSVNQSSSAPALLVLNSYLENLKTRLVITEDDKIEVKKLAIDELEIKENLDIRKGGITLYDESTGKPYCVMIKDGQLINIAGKCQDHQVKQTQNESQNLQNQNTNLQIDTNSKNINEQGSNIFTDENLENQNTSLQDTNLPNIETQDTN